MTKIQQIISHTWQNTLTGGCDGVPSSWVFTKVSPQPPVTMDTRLTVTCIKPATFSNGLGSIEVTCNYGTSYTYSGSMPECKLTGKVFLWLYSYHFIIIIILYNYIIWLYYIIILCNYIIAASFIIVLGNSRTWLKRNMYNTECCYHELNDFNAHKLKIS